MGLHGVLHSHARSQQASLHFISLYTGVPGGKANVLGGQSIGHSKQNVYMYMCPIPKGFRDRAISLYSSKTADKREILRAISNTGIYCSSYKVGTVYLV
jgi:hypothetical protein